MKSNKFIFALILLAVSFYSFQILTVKPKIWADEAKSIELARNFLNYGKLDIEVAPGEFSGVSQLLQSTGYPVTVPLAGIFRIFGAGLTQARIYMLGWMIAALTAVFCFTKRFFGEQKALIATLLVATFASFHDSGRTVVGEIPGFVFLLSGLYFWLTEKYFLSGFWFGLAVVAKPSVFGLILPAIFLIAALERTYFWKKIWKTASGMFPAAVIWFLLVLDNPFVKETWRSILGFYKNPYEAVSLWENIIRNAAAIPFSTTLIYFGGLFILLVFGRFWLENFRLKSLYNFTIVYGVLAFLYYLRSPGWLRYILIGELLILLLIPDFLPAVFKKFGEQYRKTAFFAAGFLVLVQLAHFFMAAQIFYSDTAIKVSGFLNKEFPGKSIGVINSLDISVLLDTEKRFQIAEMAGIPVMGKNPLSREPLPEIIVFAAGEKLSDADKMVLKNKYAVYSGINEYFIYKKLIKSIDG